MEYLLGGIPEGVGAGAPPAPQPMNPGGHGGNGGNAGGQPDFSAITSNPMFA